ncbi:hypothetical protein LZ31DRAFT_549304 [Colletotrichum somersetense]|nr:hypothetical protein LZ31DRAFT_549304 [Colletotrichum somersetense]
MRETATHCSLSRQQAIAGWYQCRFTVQSRDSALGERQSSAVAQTDDDEWVSDAPPGGSNKRVMERAKRLNRVRHIPASPIPRPLSLPPDTMAVFCPSVYTHYAGRRCQGTVYKAVGREEIRGEAAWNGRWCDFFQHAVQGPKHQRYCLTVCVGSLSMGRRTKLRDVLAGRALLIPTAASARLTGAAIESQARRLLL